MNFKITLFCIGLSVLFFAGAVILGGPNTPPPIPSINNPFKSVNFTDLPPITHFFARDGAKLGFRTYGPRSQKGLGSVVLVHGSSASSNSMHLLAKALAGAGYKTYAIDVRGHGVSGSKGHIAYVGQLEDDLEDFVRYCTPPTPSTLAGFSSGGGFVIRFAGSVRQKLFQNYLFLSPFISPDSPTERPNSGGWVSVGIPRIIAVTFLNAFGIRAFNDLPVIRFALSDEVKTFLTPEYSFALWANFQPQRDYAKNIKAIEEPCQLLAGTNDEVFYTDRFAEMFRLAGKKITVTLLPGIGHIPLILEPMAIAAIVNALNNKPRHGI